MFRFLLCLGAGLIFSAAALADDASWRTKPADPQVGTRPPRYAPVTAGVKRFRIVEPKNWLVLNRAAGAPGGPVTKGKVDSMPTMPGMDHGSMPGMKMDGGRM
jgi:hypothetical protein